MNTRFASEMIIMAEEEKQAPESVPEAPAPAEEVQAEPAPEALAEPTPEAPEAPAEEASPPADESPEEVPTTNVSPNKPNTSGVVEDGSGVKVHYKGTLESGEVFDSSEGKDPLEFKVGQQMVIKGFDEGVRGMKEGEKKTLTIPPEDAYGQPQPDLQQKVPKDAFGDITPEEGMQLALNHPQAPGPIPVRVLKVEDDGVTIDLNHPLAGKTLNFEIEVVEIN